MNLEEKKLALEEKWFDLRKEAFQLKQAQNEKEKAESGRLKLNPVLATIMVALIGLFGTAIATIINNKNTNELEQRRFEADLIKKSLEEHTQEDKVKSLRLLTTLHLIHDLEVKTALDSFLTNIDSAIKALPSSEPRVIFEKSSHTIDEFKSYVANLDFSAWKPRFIVLHNTVSPNLKQWKLGSGKSRLEGFQHFYTEDQHWNGGPHLFIADDTIWVFNPLTKPGVHSPSWNKISIGIEMIGDYNTEPFDENVKLRTVNAIAVLCKKLGLPATAIKLHSEDPLTTRKCPGKNVDKNEIIRLVQRAMEKE